MRRREEPYPPFDALSYLRFGSPRSAVGPGSGVPCASMPASSGSTSFDGRTPPSAIVFVVLPRSIVSKSQRGRSPPGASIVTRMREPARNACATGKIGTRTSVNAPFGSGAPSCGRCVGTGSVAVDSLSSSLRCDARSQPFWT